MKKYRYLPILLLAVFLLLCACAQNVTDQPETTPSSSSPVQLNSKPAAKPTSTPTIIPTVVTQPTTKPTAAPTKPTTKPTTAPTKPTTPPPTTQPNLKWLTNREIVPFEERFKEDVPFGYGRTSWLMPWTYPGYPHYRSQYRLMINSYFSNPIIIMEQGVEEDERVYWVPISIDRFDGLKILALDGRWGYFCNNSELCRLELLTGELITLATRNEGDIRWEVQACGKDTVCVFRIDAERNLHVFYRDLHSEAEKTIYKGVLPNVPMDADNLKFYASTTTQGQAYWETMNPAFYEVYLKELNDPNSPLKNSANLYKAVQDHYSIPMLVRYTCDFATGELTEDFGLYDTCWNTEDCKHDHWNYENTREEVPAILDVAPTEIPDIAKPEGDDIWYEADSVLTGIYSDFGYGQPYVVLEGSPKKLADFAVTDSEISSHFVYFVTTEGTLVQFNYKNTDYKTIYRSENQLREPFWCGDYLYFVDGNTIVCIDIVAGTYRPVIQTTLDEIYIVGEEYIHYPDDLYFGVRQGMYYKEYRYDAESNKLIEDTFVP